MFENTAIRDFKGLKAEGRILEGYTHYPLLAEKIRRGVEDGFQRVVFTDVDYTLILGSGYNNEAIAQSYHDSRTLISSLNRDNTIIIPITGSHFESGTSTTRSVVNRIKDGELPHVDPSNAERGFRVDGYVSDGGGRAVFSQSPTRIHYDLRYQSDIAATTLDYDDALRQALGLSLTISEEFLSPLNMELIRSFDEEASGTRFTVQPGTLDGHHREVNKIAFYFYANTYEDRNHIEEKFNDLARDFGFKVVCCEEKDANSRALQLFGRGAANEGFPKKYCLDLVPYNKGSVVEYFAGYINHLIAGTAAQLGESRPIVEFWGCGDSGNDFSMLSSAAITNAVIVGGASRELTSSASRLKDLGKTVFLETDPNRLGPASIIQALNEVPTLERV